MPRSTTVTPASLLTNNQPLNHQPAAFPAKAKRVIVLWQGGAPSHVDLFDYKPGLVRQAGAAGSRFGAGGGAIVHHDGGTGRASRIAAHQAVQAVRQKRIVAVGNAAAYRLYRGRYLSGEIHAYGSRQPCAGSDVLYDGQPDTRTAKHGRVGHLRFGQPCQRPAGLLRDDLD